MFKSLILQLSSTFEICCGGQRCAKMKNKDLQFLGNSVCYLVLLQILHARTDCKSKDLNISCLRSIVHGPMVDS